VTERLLEYFRRHAGPDSLAFASETRLVETFQASHDELADALRQLESQGQVRILSSLPFVALKLRVWSGSNSHRVAITQQISSIPSSVHSEVPVSSRAAAATQQEDGGAGEGERLLDQVLATLGPEADRDEFRAILAGYDPALIHRCLRRVQATKAIRVSRAALFRSLLHKLSS
jgi:hypothetical protein